MKWGCLSSAPSTPASFTNHGTLVPKQFQKNRSKSFPTSSTYCFYPLNNRNSRSSSFSVKASGKSFSTRNQTLTRNWTDVSNSSAASPPSSLPRFEELDTTDMLIRQRIVFLGSQIDDSTADLIIGQLLYLDSEDPKKDIKLFINTPGGTVYSGMAIYDAMKFCKADVSTVCMGFTGSMGAFILATGTKGKRFCMPNSRVMIHQQSGWASGSFIESMIQMREIAYGVIKIRRILSRVTGKTEEQIELDTSHDYFMDPWEAKEYGLVDEVIDDGKPGLVAPRTDSSAPPLLKEWFLWDDRSGIVPPEEELPSEENMLQNGSIGGSETYEVKQGKEKEAPTPV